ncbi:MAG: FAD-dependent oxidoreductase [Eubacterium sp.]|nr:FAD-dependent oxidoreductase [Eubacterium sp.]
MLRVSNVKTEFDATFDELINAVSKKLKIKANDIEKITIKRRSLDFRKSPQIFYVHTIDVICKNEAAVLGKNKKNNDVRKSENKEFEFKINGKEKIPERPVIIGMGPAGLFCGLFLSNAGYKPLIVERGEPVEERIKTVSEFWESGTLNKDSNVQFGEGGAGTFSDGKLNTLVKDTNGLITRVLKEFVRYGAKESILYDAKPHIGTDALCGIIKNMRQNIIDSGGEILFNTKFLSFDETPDGNFVNLSGDVRVKTSALVLATGHSARDTFEYLVNKGMNISPKPFAVGFRVEHPQSMINFASYKGAAYKDLPAATYKVTAKTKSGRGVYSFCMCPGGFVVNSSSEENMVAINGMSYSKRDGLNANSAVIITVTPEDFPSDDALGGVLYQRQIEKKTFDLGGGKVPQQLLGDFKKRKISTGYGEFSSQIKGDVCFADLNGIFTEDMREAFLEGMEHFGKIIEGFDRDDAIISAVESRTSSPIRINRNKDLTGSFDWIYPCGEGAGYAGGITSAAMDGIRCAQAIADKYCP